MDAVCSRCGYNLKIKEKIGTCPYCGEKNTLSEVKGAEDLVEEVL